MIAIVLIAFSFSFIDFAPSVLFAGLYFCVISRDKFEAFVMLYSADLILHAVKPVASVISDDRALDFVVASPPVSAAARSVLL